MYLILPKASANDLGIQIFSVSSLIHHTENTLENTYILTLHAHFGVTEYIFAGIFIRYWLEAHSSP